MAEADIFTPRKKKHPPNLSITAILDVMVTIIFFLLVGTSFETYTKLTVPPSKVSAVSEAEADPPANPRVSVRAHGSEFTILLAAGGRKGVELTRNAGLKNLREVVGKLVGEYFKNNPKETTYQLTIESSLSYQVLISTMDGIRLWAQDIVLVAPQDSIKGKHLQESVI
jgi:biopolymer transport protein ExbD